MNTRATLVLTVAAGVTVLAAVVYLTSSAGPEPKPPSPAETTRRTQTEATPPLAQSPGAASTTSKPEAPSSNDPVRSSIERLFARLQSGEASDADLDALRRELLAADPQQASAAIRAFLASGRDLPTRQELIVGEGGTLAGAPTLRTLLLDVLGQISRKTGSDAAAVASRAVLETKQSPDEWAVALRNVAWSDPKSKPYLASKMREMLSYQPWTEQPSAGFLEAFDVIVYSGDPAFIPQLADLMRNGDLAMRRAATVALDRLSAMAPLQVMTYLNNNPAELGDRPFIRADYYAKADLANPAQRQALETYLSRGDVSLPEKQKLLGGLATPASFVSDNLLTPSPAPEADDSGARQQLLSQTLASWQQQGRFPELKGDMSKVQQRLGR